MATKILIAVAVVGGAAAVPLSSSSGQQKSAPAPTDQLLGRWNRHVNAASDPSYTQYIELKSGGRYTFATVINGEMQESGTGTWKRGGDKVTFTVAPGSKTALLLEEAELVDGTMLRFSPFHAFCRRDHPHEPVREAKVSQSPGDAKARFTEWLNRQPDKTWKGRYCVLSIPAGFPGELHAYLTGDVDKARAEVSRLLKSHGLNSGELERRGKLLFIE